jgi:hypothetical protein
MPKDFESPISVKQTIEEIEIILKHPDLPDDKRIELYQRLASLKRAIRKDDSVYQT